MTALLCKVIYLDATVYIEPRSAAPVSEGNTECPCTMACINLSPLLDDSNPGYVFYNIYELII
jgi:hypothetical protein